MANSRFLTYIITTLFLLSLNTVQAQTVNLRSEVDSVHAGQVFELSIKSQLDEEVDEIIFPDSTSFPTELLWLGVQHFKVTDFSDSLRYRLQYFGNTDVLLPGLPVYFIQGNDTSIAFTNSISLFFRSVLPSDDAELKPMKPIFSFDELPWFWIISLLLLIAALIFWYSQKNKPVEHIEVVNTIAEPEPFVNPIEVLKAQLTFLKEDYKLSETKDFKFFYSTPCFI